MTIEELESILKEVNNHLLSSPEEPSPMRAMAGGSVTNTIRGLSAGFGVSCGLVGAYGDNKQGESFVENMSFSGVNISRLRMKKGPTGQVIFLLTKNVALMIMFMKISCWYIFFLWACADIGSVTGI